MWLTNDGVVPDGLCYIAAPTIVFTRMASLIWTCVVSFNVLMSVQKRKWFWKNQETDWENYRKLYFCVIALWACPSTLLTMVSQYTAKASDPLGCAPLSESLGAWYIILFTEMIPILLAFCFNIYVFFTVRQKMAKSAFPQSVRNKRKRVMYHYVIVCILCWIPMIVLEVFQISRVEPFILDVVARIALYISGFLNFLVFGMQDPHLKRSMEVLLYRVGLGNMAHFLGLTTRPSTVTLKAGDVDKMVMFQEETLISNADLSKDRFSIYRNRKLSKEDKRDLYEQRPDLDPKVRLQPDNKKHVPGGSGAAPRKSAMKKSNASLSQQSSVASSSKPKFQAQNDDHQMETPLLSATNFHDDITDGQNSPLANDHVQLSERHSEQSNASNQSLTMHDLTALSHLAGGNGHQTALAEALHQPRALSNSATSPLHLRGSSSGARGSESKAVDVETGALLADVDAEHDHQGSYRSEEEEGDLEYDGNESSDDEIDEEDEYLMQPPTQ